FSGFGLFCGGGCLFSRLRFFLGGGCLWGRLGFFGGRGRPWGGLCLVRGGRRLFLCGGCVFRGERRPPRSGGGAYCGGYLLFHRLLFSRSLFYVRGVRFFPCHSNSPFHI